MRTWLFVLLVGFAIDAHSATHQIIHVDDNALTGGDGTAAKPYNTIAAAVARARVVGGDPTIKVEPGLYELASTIIIDIPLDLVGSSVLEIDSNGWPTGVASPGTETRIVGLAALGTLPLVSVGRTDGVVMNDVNIRGFSFEGGPGGGNDINLQRVQNFSVIANVFTGPSPLPMTGVTITGIFPVASSGSIVGNYIAGEGCGTCITAGYPSSPAYLQFTGNRSVHNQNGGLLLNGSSFGIPDHGDQLDVLVLGNDLSENTGANSFGMRVFVVRKDLPDTQSRGNVNALILSNHLFGNQIGISIDAGFPYRQAPIPPPNGPLVCDTRVYSGTLNLVLTGNALSGSLLTPALISFTREQATLNPAQQQKSWQYLHNAAYIITDPQGSLAGYTKDHPSADPFVGGLCAADTTHELLGNTLIYNGTIVPATQ
jgi:hypothetical protein